jgi:hypothetical protein
MDRIKIEVIQEIEIKEGSKTMIFPKNQFIVVSIPSQITIEG